MVISCGYKKRTHPCQAWQMYIGSYFRAMLRYALSVADRERIYILLAKYGLLRLTDPIEPYNLKMGMPGSIAAAAIAEQAERLGIAGEQVLCLGGQEYVARCRAVWKDMVAPLSGGMGNQMRWMKAQHGRLP